MDFVVDDAAVPAIGKSLYILVWNSRDDLFDDLFALASHNHVDIGAALEQILDIKRGLVAPHDCADLIRQRRDKVTYLLEPRCPLDADAQKVYLFPDELAQCPGILVGPLIAKVEKCDLTDQVFHARGNILKPGWREYPHGDGRIANARVQGESVFEFSHAGIVRKD
jgi:hypothetical protein